MTDTPDPRNIPVLTDAVADVVVLQPALDTQALHAAILSETLELADSLLQQAAREIEAVLLARVLDRLRAELPHLIDRVVREHYPSPRAL